MPKQSYYDILQVSPIAELEVIQGAYKRLAFKYHPDRNSDPSCQQKMRLLNEAYRVLSDPRLRAAYDSKLKKKQNKKTSGNEQSSADHSRQQDRQTEPHKEPAKSAFLSKAGLFFVSLSVGIGLFLILIVVLVLMAKGPKVAKEFHAEAQRPPDTAPPVPHHDQDTPDIRPPAQPVPEPQQPQPIPKQPPAGEPGRMKSEPKMKVEEEEPKPQQKVRVEEQEKPKQKMKAESRNQSR
ncbi:MAG TPA: DnaJ domain-containing protein [Gemmataceae bacterium]|jgi:hypothetical protein|nr:DnaJ domain-containing protein [Gemmataceae bacterium]